MRDSVLIVGSFSDSAPLERYVSGDLAERLLSRGWAVWSTSRKQARLPRLCDMIKTVWNRRDDYSVALVDVFSGPAFCLAEAVAWSLRRLAKPYVLTLHGGSLPRFAAAWPRRVRRLLNSANVVTSPSGYLKKEMLPYCQDIRVIPNPISIGHYPWHSRGPARPRLVWLRAFHEIYNPTMAIEAFAASSAKRPGLHLTMAGPDKGDGSLQRAVASAKAVGVTHGVQFLGLLPKNAVPKTLSQSDLFLNTASIDNTPVSVIEAMACGLCVISTNVGGVPYLLEHQIDSLLVPPGNAQAMSEAIERVLGDPVLTRQLSTRARQKAEQFDWAVVLPTWENLFRRTIESGPLKLNGTLSVGSQSQSQPAR